MSNQPLHDPKNPENDPNYVIVTIIDYVNASHSIGERAGILLGVSAVMATTLLLLSTDAEADLTVIQSIYQYVLPFVFLLGAFFAYAYTLINQFSAMPIGFLYQRAKERSITADPSEMPQLQEGLDMARKNYEKKKHGLRWGNSTFIVSVILLFLVNIVPAKTIEKRLDINTGMALLVITVLVAIITGLIIYIIKVRLFGRHSRMFKFSGLKIQEIGQTVNISVAPPQVQIMPAPPPHSTDTEPHTPSPSN